jgi:hypothetical protein
LPARPNSRAKASAPAPAKIFSVYDGQRCAGFILALGKDAFEAFDRDENSLGVFASTREATAAISGREVTGIRQPGDPLDPALAQASAGYDSAFENAITAAVTDAIFRVSLVTDAVVISVGETAQALTIVLASMLGLAPPHERDESTLRQIEQAFSKKLRDLACDAANDPELYEFRRRTFSDDERGGHA